jgi:hypothetical protein
MHTTFIQKAAQQIAEKNAESWEPWRGDCHCGKVDALGFCDRCTECAVQSIYENEREYGGSTESAMSYLMIDDSDRYARILDHIVGASLEIQAGIWRDATKLCKAGK